MIFIDENYVRDGNCADPKRKKKIHMISFALCLQCEN